MRAAAPSEPARNRHAHRAFTIWQLETGPRLDYICKASAGHGQRTVQEESVLTEIHRADLGAALAAGASTSPVGHEDSDRLLSTILASLEDDKAEDIVTIPLTGKSDLADHMVIASGRSSRQVQAIAEKLAERVKQGLGIVCRTEGGEVGDWVLIDAGDVIAHIFRPEVRDFYQLEKMWLPQNAAPKRAADQA